MNPTCRISWAGNLLMLSDLTFGPSFKVKRWFTGFGDLSFWWIQIGIGSPMRRSSCCWLCAFFLFLGRSNGCSPGNKGVDVFKLIILHIQLLFLEKYLFVYYKSTI